MQPLDQLASALESVDNSGGNTDNIQNTHLETHEDIGDVNPYEKFENEINYLNKHLTEMDKLYSDMRELTDAISKSARKGGKNLSFIHQNTANLVALKTASLQGLKALVDTKQKAFGNKLKANPIATDVDTGSNIPAELLALIIEKSANSDSGNMIHEAEYSMSDADADAIFDNRLKEINAENADTVKEVIEEVIEEVPTENELDTTLSDLKKMLPDSHGVVEPEIIFGSDSNWYVVDENNKILSGYALPTDPDPEIEEDGDGFVAIDSDGYEYDVVDVSLLVR